MDCVITDATIVTPAGCRSGSIAIDDGQIVAVDDSDTTARGTLEVSAAETVIDASDMIALPGAIDVHTHMHDEVLFPDGIDLASQTASAVAGGVTTVVELPTQTPVTTPDDLREKRAVCDKRAHIDVGLVAGNYQTTPTATAVEGLIAAGVPEFKTFTAAPYQADDETILGLMSEVGSSGGTVRVHCETQALMDSAREAIDSADPIDHHRARPLEAELEAISRIGWFAEATGCPAHIVHISSGSGAAIASRFDSRASVPITLETCPQYLAFAREDVPEQGPFLKTNPSLKSRVEVNRLWQAVADGTIDLIGTDHFPTFRASRERGWDDIWEPYAGLPGVETMLEFLVSEGVHEGRISWPRLLELVCAAPARAAGCYPRKGSLAVGTDADIVLIREDSYNVSADDLAFVGQWTPFSGRTWSARVDTVIANGEVVARDHEVRSSPGDGSFLPRGPCV